MRKLFLTLCIASCVGLLFGCSQGGQPADSSEPSAKDGVLEATIVDGSEEHMLLLAGEDKEDVYLLGTDSLPVTVDKKKADASALKDGMHVTVRFDGSVEKTFPMSLNDPTSIEARTSDSSDGKETPYFDLCGLYLQVLNDLVAVHPEWDGDQITYYSFDLSTAPGGLSEGEKTALCWKFAVDHKKTPLFKDLDTLLEEEYLDLIYIDGVPTEHPQLHEWNDGRLFSIKKATGYDDETYPDLHFDASVWQNPEQSTYFSGCGAKWQSPEKLPTYEVIAQFDGVF